MKQIAMAQVKHAYLVQQQQFKCSTVEHGEKYMERD